MSDPAKIGLQGVIRPQAANCAMLMKELTASSDQPNRAMDALWLKEAEDRMAAYRFGKLGAVDAEKAFAELSQRV
ncbi:MAG TPA: addiction module protein [Rhodanobacteraceae bacterium]|nr:addiction module protein [Rhodanobacteraceae bacterium]